MARLEKSKILIFCLKNTFGEPSSKIFLYLSKIIRYLEFCCRWNPKVHLNHCYAHTLKTQVEQTLSRLSFRPQRRRESLSEFLEPDDGEFDGSRPFYNGHHRYPSLSLQMKTRSESILNKENPDRDRVWMSDVDYHMVFHV